MAEGATVANAFVQIMPSMEGATSSISQAIMPGVESAGGSAGASFGNVFAGKMGTALKAAGGAMIAAFSVSAMKDAYAGVEAGLNNVKIATGATGDAANELKAVYLDVSKNVVGSFEDIGSAVGELNTRFGLQGDELESASEQAMKYAKITGQDATKAIQDVSRMMNNAGIPASEYASTLDKLTVAGQAAGIDVGKLATSVNDNAASFKAMGFSTDEAIAMLASFEKSGANASQVLAGMKKGVAEWAKEGVSAKDGFAQFVQGVQDGTVSSADAIDIFGARAGVAMYDAASKGQLDFQEMYAAITENSSGALDSIYNDTLTAGEKFDLLGQKLQAGFFEVVEPIVDMVMPFVDMAVEGIGQVIEAFVGLATPAIQQFTEFLTPIMEAVLPELQSVFGEVMGAIGEIIATVWPVIQETITTVMGVVGTIVQQTWPIVKEVILSAVGAIRDFIKTSWPAISQVISNAMGVIKGVIDAAWPAIRTVIEVAGNAIKAFMEQIWPQISGVVQTAMGVISKAIDSIKPVVNVIKDIFGGIKSAIDDPLGTAQRIVQDFANTVSSIFGNLDFSLPSIALPHFYVWGGEFPYGIGGMGSAPEFDVQWYGQGGFADDATLNGYGERGLEFYWPSYSPYFEKYAKGIAEHMPVGAVDIHDCTFVVRNDSDIRRVAVELNTLINRQTAGGIA